MTNIKLTADFITCFRFIFGAAMVLVRPFSWAFWVCYISGGVTDMLDGFVARKFEMQSETGAKLDSMADLFFGAAILIVVVKNFDLPLWLWIVAGITAFVRVLGYCIGFYKYHEFSSLHTYMNKAAGGLIFIFPLMYIILGETVSEVIICIAAVLSGFEELVITMKSEKLNRDCKGLFFR